MADDITMQCHVSLAEPIHMVISIVLGDLLGLSIHVCQGCLTVFSQMYIFPNMIASVSVK